MSTEEKDVVMGNTPEQESDVKNGKKENTPEVLSDEDMKLKSDLRKLAYVILEGEESEYSKTLDQLTKFITESTTSMTAVPKPLKFLRPFVKNLSLKHEELQESGNSISHKLADVLSILYTTFEDEGQHNVLKYRCLSDDIDFEKWGHEYMRHLSLQMGQASTELEELNVSDDESKEEDELDSSDNDAEESESTKTSLDPSITVDKILHLAEIIVPYFVNHNGETDAVDLLAEMDEIDLLIKYTDKSNYDRVCKYIIACAPLLPSMEAKQYLTAAHDILLKNESYAEALHIAIRLDDKEKMLHLFQTVASDLPMQMQLAYILSEHKISLDIPQYKIPYEILNNHKLPKNYKYLQEKLNLKAPKVPEDVYKSHLEDVSFFKPTVDPDEQNLSTAFVNGYLNLGYCKDKLILDDDDFAYKTKDAGKISSVASIGAIFQWEEEGLQNLDKYLYSDDVDLQCGALIGLGLLSAGVRHEAVDETYELLVDFVHGLNDQRKKSACIGLALAFSGSRNEKVLSYLMDRITEEDSSFEVACAAALGLGHAYVGSGNPEIAEAIVLYLLDRPHEELSSPWTKFMCLGLGLLFLGMGENVDDAIELVSALDHPMTSSIETLIMVCAFAGSGDVLFVQDLLSRIIDDSFNLSDEDGEEVAAEDNETADPTGLKPVETTDDKQEDDEMDVELKSAKDTSNDEEQKKLKKANDLHQSFYAVLGIATTVMGEDIGKEMSLRHFGHLMHYGDEYVKRAVPLALSLLSVSNPQINIYETLSRYTHDEDMDVSSNAIYAMGIVGAGTNNSRLAQLLRNLASYYSNSSSSLFMTRIAQGLVHLGKGTITLDCYNDSGVLNKSALASLLTVMVGLTEPTFMFSHQYMFYFLNAGMRPKYLITLDEAGSPIQVNVRVGQAVDIVGQAGKPKDITGWTTHATPVLLNHNERAELETNEYISLTSKIEGVVILRKNPDYKEE
ncbi:hypothetical protein ACO0OL_000831 [Hanseniaspora opuntiae]